jgi:hypothetical protein
MPASAKQVTLGRATLVTRNHSLSVNEVGSGNSDGGNLYTIGADGHRNMLKA